MSYILTRAPPTLSSMSMIALKSPVMIQASFIELEIYLISCHNFVLTLFVIETIDKGISKTSIVKGRGDQTMNDLVTHKDDIH